MHTCCIIGDIHGCYTSLVHLLNQIPTKVDTYIFLGDYIDRGPASQEVINRILEFKLEHPHVITLLGNHEYMLKNFLSGRDDGIFLQAGGKQTLASYGVSPDISPAEFKKSLPVKHYAFFYDLPLLWEDTHAFYVHAGLQPGVHSSRQTRNWCLWVRQQFIHNDYDFGKPVVFGHTVFTRPLIQKNKIGIDTGAVYGQSLTALLLPDMEFISVPGETDHPYPHR